MTITTNGKWAIEDYQNHDGCSRYRLLYGGKVVMDDVPDAYDLHNLFAVSLVALGFASLAQSYHDKTLNEDDGTLEYLGPVCSPVAAEEVLAHCRGDLAKLPMPAQVCAHLDLPDGSSYGEGVEQFWKGYRNHSRPIRQSHISSPEKKATAGVNPEEEAFFKGLEEMQ